VVATMTVAKANRRSLNVEGAYRHILTDLYGFAGTLIAGIVIAQHASLATRNTAHFDDIPLPLVNPWTA